MKDKKVSVKYSYFSSNDQFVDGIKVDINNEPFALYKGDELKDCISTLARLQRRGNTIAFVDSTHELSTEEFEDYYTLK